MKETEEVIKPGNIFGIFFSFTFSKVLIFFVGTAVL
jgi:hypothetical protein